MTEPAADRPLAEIVCQARRRPEPSAAATQLWGSLSVEYIRQLMRGAQRPEVRAAAGRLAQALDAAPEHKPKSRGSARRGRPFR